jgi:hypothetical protein
MKQKKSISFFIVVVGLFWLFGTIGTSFAHHSESKTTKDKPQTEISAYQAKAVVPAISSATPNPSYTLIFELSFLVLNSPNQTFQKPVFKISFFEKVFEHLIAPKAP